MLQQLRDRIQGLVAGVIVALLVVTFALFGIQYYINDTRSEQAVAKVNGHAITASQLNTYYQVFKAQVHQNNPRYDGMFDSSHFVQQMKAHLLMQQVGRLLGAQYIRSLPLAVTPSMVRYALASNPNFQLKGVFSQRLYDNYLQTRGLTQEQQLSNEEFLIKFSQWDQGVGASSFVLPGELESAIRIAYEKRDVGYVLMDATQSTVAPKVTAQDIDAYYKAHQDQYQQAERVRVAYLHLDEKALKKKIHITDHDIEQYYQQNPERFYTPVIRHVTMVMLPLKDDASDDVVEKVGAEMKAFQAQWSQSHTPLALERFQQQHRMAKVKAMIWRGTEAIPGGLDAKHPLKAGSVTAPVHVHGGLAVFRVDAWQAAKQKALSDARPIIKKMLVSQRMADLFAEMSEQMSELAYTHPSSLDTVSDALNMPIEHTDWIQKQPDKQGAWASVHVKKGLFDQNEVQRVIFGHDVLEAKNNSGLIKLPDGSVMVLRVVAHQRARAMPLDRSLRQTIRQDIALHKRRELLLAKAKQVSDALMKGESGADVAKRYGLVWRHVQLARQNATSSDQMGRLAKSAFALQGSPSVHPMVSSFHAGRESVMVCQVLAIHPGRHVTEKQRDDLLEAQQTMYAQLGMVNTIMPFVMQSKIHMLHQH